jgi:hypothetical protein
MEPAIKSPAIEALLEKMSGRTTAIKSDTCAWCKKPVGEFHDELSKKEYTISGFCQKCQDKVFG